MSENKIVYDKPFKTYEDLIKLLESRKFVINDKEFATRSLQNISYYTLINGYYRVFETEPNSDVLKEPVLFEYLYAIHIIDSNLSNILFKYILAIERSLKSQLSYIVSKEFGVYTDLSDLKCMNNNDYLCRNNYNGSTRRRNNILVKIKREVDSRPNSIVKHYKDTKNHIPPWIITYNISFGTAIQWYRILNKNEKTYVCDHMISPDIANIEARKEYLIQALSLFKEYRNSMAHGNRLYASKIVTEIPKNLVLHFSGHLTNEEEYNSGISKNGIYSLILLLLSLLNDKYMINGLLSDLYTLFNTYEEYSFSGKSIYDIFNIPNDIFERFQANGNTKKD